MKICISVYQPGSHRFLLRAHSYCARALPADAAEWDVSGLLWDGKPYGREAVVCWLQCLHCAVHDEELDSDSIGVAQ